MRCMNKNQPFRKSVGRQRCVWGGGRSNPLGRFLLNNKPTFSSTIILRRLLLHLGCYIELPLLLHVPPIILLSSRPTRTAPPIPVSFLPSNSLRRIPYLFFIPSYFLLPASLWFHSLLHSYYSYPPSSLPSCCGCSYYDSYPAGTIPNCYSDATTSMRHHPVAIATTTNSQYICL